MNRLCGRNIKSYIATNNHSALHYLTDALSVFTFIRTQGLPTSDPIQPIPQKLKEHV